MWPGKHAASPKRAVLSRAFGSACVLGIWLMVLFAQLLAAQADEPSRKDLEARIEELRRSAAYAEAAEMAAELLELVRQDPEARPHEIADAERRVAMLEQIAAMSGDEQRELAEADSLQPEIDRAREQAEYALGASLAERQLVVRERILGPNHPDVARSLNNVANLYWNQGRYVDAEPLYERSLAIWEQTLGPDHPNVATSLSNLAVLHWYQGRYSDAEPLYERSLSIREQTLGPDHPDVATSLSNLAILYRVQGRYAEAEPLFMRSLAVRDQALGPDHPDVAHGLSNLAALYDAQGRYAEAEPLSMRSLAIWEQALGPDHPVVAQTLHNLAVLCWYQGRYADAEPLYERSLAIREQALGPDHPDVARSLNNLAALYCRQDRYADAEPLYERSLAIREQALGPGHPDVATSLSNLAALYQYQGRYAETGPLHERSLAIREQVLGPGHPDVATSLSNLAALYQYQGRYAEAGHLYERSLAIREQALGPDHPDVASSLNSLAGLYSAQGRYAEAGPLHERSLAIREQALGPDHPDVASSLNDLAILYGNQGRYADAEPLFERSLAISEQALGPDHSGVASSLNNLAALYWYQGRYAEAGPLHERSLAIREQAFGADHPDVAHSLSNLAALKQIQGHFADAEPLYERSLAIRDRVFGPDHPHVASILNNLAILYGDQGRYAQSLPLLARAAAVFETARLRAGEGLERATFKASPYPALAAAHLLTDDPGGAWPAVERDQGRVLADLLMRAKERRLTDLETAHEDSLRRLLDNLENRLTAGLEAAAGDTEEEREANLRQTRAQHLATQAEWTRFRREMATKYPVTEGQVFPLERVQAALGPGEAYIGWLDYEAKPDSLLSWAYVVRTDGPVAWARLDVEETLDPVADLLADAQEDDSQPALRRLARAQERCLTDRSTPQADADRIAAAFCSARLGPVLPLLEEIEHLIVIPTGVMSSIPVESLIDDQGQYLGDCFTISYIPSATIYTWLHEERPIRDIKPFTAGRTLLVGDPPFSEAHQAAMAEEEPAEPVPVPVVLADAAMLREARAGSVEALRSLPRLPFSRVELQEIAAVAPQPTLLLGSSATEQELTRLAVSGALREYRTIHLATHALADQEHPERSCLIFSQVGLPDALEQVRKGERLYDGRLTVGEILREWRLDADLVTLSACETGLGRQVRGEGVVGFAHAFLQVGARSLVVSLWPVQDRATALLMTRFYENLWSRGLGKTEALKEAKSWLREYRDMTGLQRYAHPFYWSGFVLVGERG